MKRTVLFVDDEPNILRALQRIFLDDDWLDVRTSADAESAMALLAAGKVDLLVSDQMMAGMNGAELLAAVRRLYPDMPLVLLTGYADQMSESIAATVGPDVPVVAKPWDIEALRSIVCERLAGEEWTP